MLKDFKLFILLGLITFATANSTGPGEVRCYTGAANETFVGAFEEDKSTSAAIIKRMDALLENVQMGTSLLKEITQRLNSTTATHQYLQSQNNHTGNMTKSLPSMCTEAAAISRKNGIYSIQVAKYSLQPFQVVCEEESYGGGWTVVLRRLDGSVDFFRDWEEYKRGFGNVDGEFFIGLDKLYALTNGDYPQELVFVLQDFDNIQKYAQYTAFAVGDESERYMLKTVGKYSGDAGDSFSGHAGQAFKTKDIEDVNNCAKRYTGAWWYTNCHSSNLNGRYLFGAYGQEKYAQGVVWRTWHGHNYSLKLVKMMIRPQRK